MLSRAAVWGTAWLLVLAGVLLGRWVLEREHVADSVVRSAASGDTTINRAVTMNVRNALRECGRIALRETRVGQMDIAVSYYLERQENRVSVRDSKVEGAAANESTTSVSLSPTVAQCFERELEGMEPFEYEGTVPTHRMKNSFCYSVIDDATSEVLDEEATSQDARDRFP